MKAWLIALSIAAASATARAQTQVGFPPDRSPYRDRDYNREWTFFAGRYNAERDPVGVTPLDGPMAGVRWQMHLSGPAYFAWRLAGASVNRTVIDPTKRIDERIVGTENVPMLFGDVELELSLTGHKTWHGVSPFINGGLGFTADVRGSNDVGNYRFGVPFTLNLGAGLLWEVGRTWSVRVDWSNFIYRVSYPSSYYLKTTEDPAVLPQEAPNAFWRRNPTLLVGISLFKPR